MRLFEVHTSLPPVIMLADGWYLEKGFSDAGRTIYHLFRLMDDDETVNPATIYVYGGIGKSITRRLGGSFTNLTWHINGGSDYEAPFDHQYDVAKIRTWCNTMLKMMGLV